MGIFDCVNISYPVKRMMLNGKTMMQQSLQSMIEEGEISDNTTVAQLLSKLGAEIAELRGKPPEVGVVSDADFPNLVK